MQKKKTITRTKKYLHGSAICLHPRNCKDFTIIKEIYKVRLQCFSLSKRRRQQQQQQNPNYQKGFLHPAQKIHNGL